jgi:chitin synthase
MAQVPPPVPQLQYQGYAKGPQQPQQYPPRTVMYRAGWSVMREKLMKRRSVKQVQLFRGNLVLDVPVPSNIRFFIV